MDLGIKGKWALVCAASKGLGKGCAQALVNEGVHVVITARGAEALEATAAELRALDGGQVRAVVGDITSAAGRAAALAACPQVDILINNAVFGVPGDFLDTSDEAWRRVMDVTLDSCFRLSRRAAAGMVRRGWGRVVMVSSVNAQINRGTNTSYVTAKAGIEGLTRGMAVELAAKGVTVNCIAPGYMATDINEGFRSEPARYEWIRNRTPMKRWGKPDELAGAAVFLSSEASAFMTGQVLVMDGGMTVAI